jgi:hypothetical protein
MDNAQQLRASVKTAYTEVAQSLDNRAREVEGM